jgi:hypothetical protein
VAALALLVLVSCGTAPADMSQATPTPVTPSPSSTPSVAGSASPSPLVSRSPTQDLTANWQAFKSTNGQFTLKHPASWFVSPEGVNGALVSVGMGVKHPIGGPNEYALDISVGSWPTSPQLDTSCFLLSGPTDNQAVTVQGVNGVRRTGTFTECQGGQQFTQTEYDFTTNSRNYDFTYTARPDAVPLSDFDLMVTATVIFSA